MKTTASSFVAQPSLKPLIVSIALALSSPMLCAQVPQPGVKTSATPNAAPNAAAATTAIANAMPAPKALAAVKQSALAAAPTADDYFGQVPRLKVRRKALKTEPYQPIKKPDDDGQIPEIEMFIGESRVFPTPNVARIAVGNKSVMSASALDDKEVIVFANGVGTSSLFVWSDDGRYQRVKVNVVPGDTSRVAREVAAFLSAIPNAKASIVGDKVIVEGEALSDEDRDKVGELAKRYPQIINFTSAIGWEKMVMLDVKVVEFPKSELREIGLKWSAQGGAAIGGIWGPIRRGNDGPYQVTIPSENLPIKDVPREGGSSSGGATIPTSLNVIGALNLGLSAKLNLLEQNGTASILAEPQLSARSGVKASFLAGGEFPYSVASPQGVTVMFKPYGIKLDFEPRIGRDGIIRAVIESEVSSIDLSVSSASGPALLSRKTKTEFNARSGETIVLSGLLQRNISNDIDKVPFLGNIPVLGALFRSKRYQNKETELVVFVTPTIVDAHSAGLVERVANTTERLAQRLGRTPYLSDPIQPGRPAQLFDALPGQPVKSGAPVQGSVAPGAQPTPVSALPALLPPGANPLGRPVVALTGGSAMIVLREGLILRAEPSDAAPALLELGYHALVQMGDTDAPPALRAKWRNVKVGEVNGWVHADSVTLARLRDVAPPSANNAVARKAVGGKMLTLGVKGHAESRGARAVQAAARQYRVVLDGLAMHVSPDVNSMVVEKLSGGQVVHSSSGNVSGTWIAVQSGASSGWVSAQWLQNVTNQN